MRGGPGPGEGIQELAALVLVVLLLVFFGLAIRTEWDRRSGRQVPEWSEVLSKTQKGRLKPAARPANSSPGPRQGDVI